MNRNERMVKTTFIYFIGNFGSKLLAFFLLPLYTSWLNPDQFGKIDLILSIVPLIAPVFTLQVTECIFRFLFECKDDISKKENITNALIIYLCGIVVFFIFYIPYCIFTVFEYPVLFGLYFFLMYFGIFVQQVMRAFGLNIGYACTGIISALVQGVANVILIRLIEEKSLLVAPIIAFLFIIIFGVIKTQLKFSVPLIPNQVCWWFTGVVGKYIIKIFTGATATGILAVATRFPNLVSVIMQIYFLAWVENSIVEYDSEDRDSYFSKNLNGLIEFIMFCMAGLLLAIRVYFKYAIDISYNEALTIIPILFFAMLFNCIATFLGSIYTASKETKAAFSTTLYAAISNVIISFILIPILGVIGYAVANFISYLIFAFVRYKSINKICNIKICIPHIVTIFSFLIGICIYYIGNIYVCFITIFIICIMFIFRYRNMIIGLKNRLIKK